MVLMAAVVLYTVYVVRFVSPTAYRRAPGPRVRCRPRSRGHELTLLFPILLAPARRVRAGRRAEAAHSSWPVVGCVVGALVSCRGSRSTTALRATGLLSTGTGSALSAASCDEMFYGKYIGYYGELLPGSVAARQLDESERDIAPRKHASTTSSRTSVGSPLVVAARVGRLWGVFKPGQTTALDWWLEGRGRAPSGSRCSATTRCSRSRSVGLVAMRRRKITDPAPSSPSLPSPRSRPRSRSGSPATGRRPRSASCSSPPWGSKLDMATMAPAGHRSTSTPEPPWCPTTTSTTSCSPPSYRTTGSSTPITSTLAVTRWSPYGPSVQRNADDEGQRVADYGMIPQRYRGLDGVVPVGFR